MITGGTGSLGQELTRQLLEKNIEAIRILSRDENKQAKMKEKFKNEKIKFFLGDVRDKERIHRALEGVDTVFHCAALKSVEAGQYNPFEFIGTNVIGSQNLIDVCLERNVNNVIGISTDKAFNPISVYGATKLLMEELFVAANNYKGKKDIYFKIIRLGNLFNSNGSVVEIWKNQSIIQVTDLECTRFTITLKQAAEYIIKRAEFKFDKAIPYMKSYKLQDLVLAMEKPYKIIGLRPGEKLNEEINEQYNSYQAERLTVQELKDLICE